MTSGLPGRVLEHLGPAIVNGEYPPGAVLRTEELERAHTVSRTVVREALRVLESMRLVTSRRRVGITVLPRTDWNLYDPVVIRWRLDRGDRAAQLRSLTEVRAAAEPVAAALAAARASAEHAGGLTVLAVKLRESAADPHAFLHHDLAFHRLLLVASGNEMFAQLGGVVGEVLRHRHLSAPPSGAGARLHVEVAEAIAAGDGARAESAMRTIVNQVVA